MMEEMELVARRDCPASFYDLEGGNGGADASRSIPPSVPDGSKPFAVRFQFLEINLETQTSLGFTASKVGTASLFPIANR